MIILEQEAGGRVARHVDVGPAIAIEIAAQGGERVVSQSLQDSRLRSDVRESSVTVVVVEQVARSRQSTRTAHDRDAFPEAKFAGASRGRVR